VNLSECDNKIDSVILPEDFTYIFNSIGTWAYIAYSTWNIGSVWLIMMLGSGIYRVPQLNVSRFSFARLWESLADVTPVAPMFAQGSLHCSAESKENCRDGCHEAELYSVEG